MDQPTEEKGYKSLWDFGREANADIGSHGIGEYPTQILPHAAHRVVTRFSEKGDTILDPFCGCGTFAIEAKYHERNSINYDINPNAIELAKKRLSQSTLSTNSGEWDSTGNKTKHHVEQRDARDLPQEDDSIDAIITDIPYANTIEYSEQDDDLSTIEDYDQFLAEIDPAFEEMWRVLKPGKYCIIFCADYRVGAARRIYPVHADVIGLMREIGFILFDLYIWRYYRSGGFRPFGKEPYQAMNVHSYILAFYKPSSDDGDLLERENEDIHYRDRLTEKLENNK